MDEEIAMGEEDDQVNQIVPSVVAQGMKGRNMARKVLAKADLPPDNVIELLEQGIKPNKKYGGKEIIKNLRTLRSRAFVCLSNMAAGLASEDLGGIAGLYEVWKALGCLCLASINSDTKKTDASEVQDTIEAASSAMRAITQKLTEEKALESLFTSSPEINKDFKSLLSVAALSESRIRVNFAQISGLVGNALVTSKANEAVAELCASFLVECSTRDADLRVVAEALDKTFDMFSEDDTDELCVKMQLVPRLKQLLPGLKTKMNIFKRNNPNCGESYAMIQLSKTNLVRFIKYKEKRPIIMKSMKQGQ